MSATEKFLECLNDTFTLDYEKGFPNINDRELKMIIGRPVRFEKMEPYRDRLAGLAKKPLADHALIFKILKSIKLAAWNIGGWGLKSSTADWYYHKFLNLKDKDGRDTSEAFEQWKNRMGWVLELASIIIGCYELDILCVEEGPTFLDDGLTNEQRTQSVAVLAWFKTIARSKGLMYVHYSKHALDPTGRKMGQGFLIKVSDSAKMAFLAVERDAEINNQVFKGFVEKFKTAQWFVKAMEKARISAVATIKDIVFELASAKTVDATDALAEINKQLDDQAFQKVTESYMYTLWKMSPVRFNQTAIINLHGKWGLNAEAYAWIIKTKGDLVMKACCVTDIAVIGDYNIHAHDMETAVKTIMPTASFYTTDPKIGSHSGGGMPGPGWNGTNKENLDLLITWTSA